MKYSVTDYRNGLKVVPAELVNEITNMIETMDINLTKTAVGKIKKTMAQYLLDKSWSEKIRLDESSKISIPALKNRIGLCSQTGNVSRVYADILKLQTLFINQRIDAGIIVIPTGHAARKLGGNLASYERLIRELQIFSGTITVPIAIIGFGE